MATSFFVASPQTGLKLLGSPDLSLVHPVCRSQVEATFARILPPMTGTALILTDDYNPVEVYDAANREQLRRNLARGMHR